MKLITKVVIAIVVLALLGGVVYLFATGFFDDVSRGFQCSGANEFESETLGLNLCWYRKGQSAHDPPAICLIDQSQSPYGKPYMWMAWNVEGGGSEGRQFNAIPVDSYKKINVYMRWEGGAQGLEYTYIRDRDDNGDFIHPLLNDMGRALRQAMEGRQTTMQISDQEYLDLKCVLESMVIRHA